MTSHTPPRGLMIEIQREITKVASIYPTAFNLYDEPLQRLSGRIANLPQIHALLDACQGVESALLPHRADASAERTYTVSRAAIRALRAAIAAATGD